jgi:hypothetical protein
VGVEAPSLRNVVLQDTPYFHNLAVLFHASGSLGVPRENQILKTTHFSSTSRFSLPVSRESKTRVTLCETIMVASSGTTSTAIKVFVAVK